MATPVESLVWSLLQQHCGILSNPEGNSVDFSCYPPLDTTNFSVGFAEIPEEPDPGLGARLRLAIDVVNACCACRGLDPATNQLFWRRVMTELWSKGDALPKLEMEDNFGLS